MAKIQERIKKAVSTEKHRRLFVSFLNAQGLGPKLKTLTAW